MLIYANYMQIAHYVCKYAVSASFKQAQPLWARPIRQACLKLAETDQNHIFAYLHT